MNIIIININIFYIDFIRLLQNHRMLAATAFAVIPTAHEIITNRWQHTYWNVECFVDGDDKHFNENIDNNNVDIDYNTSSSNCGDGKCDNDK